MLRNIIWKGTNFGDLCSGCVSEHIVSDGHSYVFFEMDNKSYRTESLVEGKKHRNNNFNFIDNTTVRNKDYPDNICKLITALTCESGPGEN